ncbi:MAG TPA: glycosyltransferase [Solirubrobacteraceae bacterium]
MRVLLWHVHGSWTTAFVHGSHDYVVPVLPGRGPDGRGRAQTYVWPDGVTEVTPEELPDLDVDVVVLQRPRELEHLAERWLGRRPGRDLPAIYVEHNAPQGVVNEMRHPVAAHDGVLVVHVTHFNDLFWDCGCAPTTVIEHGIVDPGHRYTGELARVGVVVNEPGRRARVTGTDLLERFAQTGPIDLFGMGAAGAGAAVNAVEDLPQARLHAELARRRVYLHPIRWTSLGLSLLEAMQLGMPVVALATTEVAEAVVPGAGVVSTNVDVLVEALRGYLEDPARAAGDGATARAAARERYGLERFLADWDRTLADVAAGAARRAVTA